LELPRAQGGVAGGRLSWREIKLPDRKGSYFLVVSRWLGSGCDPLLLLTNIEVHSGLSAEKVMRMYCNRWAAEDAARFVKQEVGLGSFLVRRLRAIGKLVTVAFMVMAFLGLLAEIPEASLEKLQRYGLSFKKRADFLYYRIIWGLRVLFENLRPHPLFKLGKGVSFSA